MPASAWSASAAPPRSGGARPALGMTVAAHDPFVADDDPVWQTQGVMPLPLGALLAASEVVSLRRPRDHHLIDAARLAAMPAGAMRSTARGGVVDEAALVAASARTARRRPARRLRMNTCRRGFDSVPNDPDPHTPG